MEAGMSPVGYRKSRIGLALSGGAARGIAHIGVLDVLHKEKIPIDLIAGTSAGSIMGALYAAGVNPETMIKYAIDTSWKKLAPYVDISLHRTGLLKGHRIKELLAGFMGGDYSFDELKIPFVCVATDIDSGEEIVMDKGKVLDAVRASISIPGIFTIVERDGRYLADGGLTTPVPVHVVKQMGADFIIAVNVNGDVTARRGKYDEKRLQHHKEPNVFHVLMQSLFITTYALSQHTMEQADVIIEPDMPHIYAGDFQKAEEMIEEGREAAIAAMPEIRKKLAQL
jgi:NTE family protein